MECDCTAYVYDISARARYKLVHLGSANEVAIAAKNFAQGLHDHHCNTTDTGFSSIFIYQPAVVRKEAWSKLGKKAFGKDAPFTQNIGKNDKKGLRRRADLAFAHEGGNDEMEMVS